MAEEDEDLEGVGPGDGGIEISPKVAANRRRILIITIVMVVALSAAGGGWFWWQSLPAGPPTQSQRATPLYLAIDPPLVTNFEVRGQIRFLQTSLEVMARDQAVIDAVTYHMPAIRNQLLLFMNDQPYEKLNNRAGREAIRAEALAEIRRVLREVGASDAVEAVYFTGFVMQ